MKLTLATLAALAAFMAAALVGGLVGTALAGQ